MPRFKLRDLFVLTTVLAVVALACTQWPTWERISPFVEIDINGGGTLSAASIEFKRRPTVAEAAMRFAVCSAGVIAIAILQASFRAKKADSE